jgi:hypothetical protein
MAGNRTVRGLHRIEQQRVCARPEAEEYDASAEGEGGMSEYRRGGR